MLNLKARIHLEEIEIPVRINDKFDRPYTVVADRFRERDRLVAHGVARRFVQKRRRCLFDDLLVPPLDRAFTLVEVNDVAMPVTQHLNFDVARFGDIFFDEQPVVAEARARLVFR